MMPDTIGDSEPDMDPSPNTGPVVDLGKTEQDMDPTAPNVTTPRKMMGGMDKTSEALKLLGAGQPYNSGQ